MFGRGMSYWLVYRGWPVYRWPVWEVSLYTFTTYKFIVKNRISRSSISLGLHFLYLPGESPKDNQYALISDDSL